MEWGGPSFVIALLAVCYVGWLINNWIRARHGYALEDEWGGKTEKADRAALEAENHDLRQQVARFEDRMRVLEGIVTDKGYAVATQIEALRDTARVEEMLEDRRSSAKTDTGSN